MFKPFFLLALAIPGAFAASQAVVADTAPIGVVADPFGDLERTVTARQNEQARQIAFQEKQFVDSFNRLAAAMEEFSHEYKATHAIDVKRVKSIREAYRKLQQADPWFRVD